MPGCGRQAVPDLPAWVIEALRAGAIVAFFLQTVANIWLARKLDEREAARAQADAAHMRTVDGLVPVVRSVASSLDAISRRLEALDIVVREDAAVKRVRTR